jgi:hypothetical protein
MALLPRTFSLAPELIRAISRSNQEISMKLSVALRGITLGAVALLSVGCVDGGYREGYYGRQLPVYRDDLDRGYRRPDYLHARRPIYRRRSASYDRAQSFINANNANRRNLGNGSHSSFGGRSGSSGSFGGRR